MHVLLTDRLSCPRCGPEFGLILLAERMDDRRVLAGRMGCPNCRDRFPVSRGFGDLRAPPRAELSEAGGLPAAEPEATERLQALLAVAEGPGNLVLAGPVAAHAAGLADRVPELEVVAVSPALRDDPERAGVSRLVSRPGLPFFSGTFRGAALSGDASDALLEEAARVLAPGARLVVFDAPPDARARAEAGGLRVLLDDPSERVVVGARENR